MSPDQGASAPHSQQLADPNMSQTKRKSGYIHYQEGLPEPWPDRKVKATILICLNLLLCQGARAQAPEGVETAVQIQRCKKQSETVPVQVKAGADTSASFTSAGSDSTSSAIASSASAGSETSSKDDSDYQGLCEKIQFARNEELIRLFSEQPELLRKWSRAPIASNNKDGEAGGEPGSSPRLKLMELAVSFNNLDLIDWLFKNLPPDLALEAKHAGLLSLAIPNHDLRTLKYLIDQGVPVFERDTTDASPLSTAIWLRDREAADMLMAAGAKTDQFTDTALSHLDKIKKLISASPNCVSARDGQGRTLLHWAAVDGQCTLIELLLKNGADIDDRQGSFAMTPLEVAVANNCQSAAKLLLDNGAAPNGRPGDRQTPLGLAAGMHSTILVNMLLERGAQLNARDGQGKTPLERALERNDEMLADYLKSRGASP